jgi:hypothetical protein
MQASFTKTGGARIGWLNASWPLAKLSATHDNLTLTARLFGKYRFSREQVSAIERYVMIPVLAWGVRVRHCVPDYPQQIIFWSLGSPDDVLSGILATGFVPAATISTTPLPRGIPVRWSAIIVTIVAWNALFMFPFVGRERSASPPNGLILVPLIAALGLSVAALKSSTLQRLILKPERSVGEIRPFLLLLAFISGVLLVVFTILLATGAFHQTPNQRAGGKGRIASLCHAAHPWPAPPQHSR